MNSPIDNAQEWIKIAERLLRFMRPGEGNYPAIENGVKHMRELLKMFDSTYCVYCGWTTEIEAPDVVSLIQDHIFSCPSHPMATAIEILRKMEWGYSTVIPVGDETKVYIGVCPVCGRPADAEIAREYFDEDQLGHQEGCKLAEILFLAESAYVIR